MFDLVTGPGPYPGETMFRISLLAVALQACLIGQIGSGDPVTQERDVGVDAVSVSLETMVETTVVAGAQANSLSITCDDNLINDMITEVEDGVLRIRTESGVNLRPRGDCFVQVEIIALEQAHVSGPGRLELSGDLDGMTSLIGSGSGSLVVDAFETCDLSVVTSGTGSIEIEHLVACDVIAEVSGTGRVVMQGRADLIEVEVSGAGGLRNPNFEVNAADIDLSGTGGLELTVHQALRARLSGTGGATIYGNPEQRDIEETGPGRVRFGDAQ